MASFMLRRIFQRGFSRTNFQHAIQRQTIQEDNLISSKKQNNTPTIIDDPLQHDDYFNVRSMVTLEDLFKNRAHYGHVTGMRNPWMSPYIYGHRLDVDIIDLDKTLPMLHSALNFLAHIAYRQGIILFLTRYPAHVPLVERAARDCGEYAHCRKWDYPFTNTKELFGYDIRLPDVCIFTHTLAPPNQLHPAISDSNKLLIPTVALCDTDCNPNIITYPIPSNDDTLKLIEFYLTLFQQAIMAGKEKRREKDSFNQ
ncbi:unnamed protein product [Rotaria sp. Silwood1]|nr:unnamed protein product [Rotaria sp. Silwood1]CAF1410293.1 unnamed protein product [Rotaria sp. Silwood1]CAF3610466.1 unnamed protein product [Rotaria sp. Silwood1]CAF3612613.1 unnamed protein product [Rotaria sp. Silwood1]CAF3632434.1 unnamed protein product [Rotaria sp. Silwood1]